jgi:hypothetical protein
MARILDWLASPWALQRLGVVFCVIVALSAGVVRYPSAMNETNNIIAHNAALDFADREFAGGNGIVVDQNALYEARSLIPSDASYRVVTGAKQPTFSDLTIPWIAAFATSFLLPRRPSLSAPWVLCYGCDAARLPHGEVVWKDNEGISIIKLRQ